MPTKDNSTRLQALQFNENGSPLGIAPLLVTVETACFLLSLGRSKVYELIASGALPSLRIGSARRIPVTAVQDWIAAASRSAGGAGPVQADWTGSGR